MVPESAVLPEASSLLDVANLTCGYADGIAVLHDLSLRVDAGELVTLIGPNGAGKTTTMKAIMGLLRRRAGSVRFSGAELAGWQTADIARAGIALVPEGRGVFPGLSVLDNLRVAATPWNGTGRAVRDEIARVLTLFPALAEQRRQLAWSLSGGQQQMLAIGRALVARPRLMLLDEPSLGLAPKLVDEVFDTLVSINRQGVAMLLVEQNATLALEISSRAYVIEQGRITLENAASALLGDPRVREAYLGVSV
jgi:branched-chain amino acid transport system ATP-binding protein